MKWLTLAALVVVAATAPQLLAPAGCAAIADALRDAVAAAAP